MKQQNHWTKKLKRRLNLLSFLTSGMPGPDFNNMAIDFTYIL